LLTSTSGQQLVNNNLREMKKGILFMVSPAVGVNRCSVVMRLN